MSTTIGYATKGEEVETIVGTDFTVLDGMLEVQAHLGQITWTELTETVARGIFTGNDGPGARVIVVDVDNANVADALKAVVWVNE